MTRDNKQNVLMAVKVILMAFIVGGAVQWWSLYYHVRYNAQWDLAMSCGYHRFMLEEKGVPETVGYDDIIVFNPPNVRDIWPADKFKKLQFAKRVKAMEGDIVEVKGNEVFINGVLVADRPLLAALTKLNLPHYTKDWQKTLGPGEFFVMGDRGEKSFDSRYWGVTSIDHVVGAIIYEFF